MTYDNTNRGQIWKNDDKQTDNHPDFKGTLNVNGQEFWVAAWKRREGANPKAPALTFTIKPKDEKQQSISQRATPKGPAPNKYAAATGRDPFDDDLQDAIPF